MKKLGVITSLALAAFLAISVVPAGAQTPAGTTVSVTEPAANSTPAPASVTTNLNLIPSMSPKAAPAAASSSSSDFHRFEVFAGYSFLSNNAGFDTQLVHGYAASVKFNLNRNFGILADFSGHNGSQTQFSEDQDEDQYYFVFGPEVSHSFGKARISGHVLVGIANQHASVISLNCSECTPFSLTEHNFAAGAGGSFDWMFSDRWGWRVLQFDYLTSIFDGSRVNNVRGETGIIVRFK